ncbi:3-oxoacyl-[acyl-carrier-protein] synthase III C-terminal domain-containing protein [Kitasatospora aureofaciens]|uniref:3-oxoacyl-[acyl-carrier-protein] synthase III C-terminal domain-containing protein n=1 Tax=Kitasatospora aureofaciens TaxID=1894 RepID=UPI00068FED6E|nr:3-oxoacyl-[acyl-carrier-protein] synthase III C-terminal domain-containing protein [Kitasatospora aureofaciens]
MTAAPAAFITRPAVVRGPHVIPASRIRDDILAQNPDHPQAEKIRRATANLPGTRRYFHDYASVTRERTAAERKRHVLDTLLPAAEEAVRQALKAADLQPAQVDCLIVTSATGDMVPGLHQHLLNTLALRPDTRVRATAQAACAGGALSLIAAEEHLARYPDHIVVVVAAEHLSSIHQRSRVSLDDQIFKVLWGDAVAAAVVASRPLGRQACLRIDHTKEHTIPGTLHRYQKETDHLGDHFASTRDSLRSVTNLTPVLRAWLGDLTGGKVDFGVLHPGGPQILARLGKALGVDEAFTVHSADVLAQEGNLGGATIFSVLDRTYASSAPADGARGLVFGLGPGVTLGALLVTWTQPRPA